MSSVQASERREQVLEEDIPEEVERKKKIFRHPSPLSLRPHTHILHEHEQREKSSDFRLKILLDCILLFSYFLWFTFFNSFVKVVSSFSSFNSTFFGSSHFKDKSGKMAKYRSTMAIDTSKSDFNDFYEIAAHPRTMLQPQSSIESKEGKKRRPFTSFFSNGLHMPPPSSTLSSAGLISGTRNNYLQTPITIREPTSAPILESHQESSNSDPNRTYVRRGSFILSSGRDKFTFDSEGMSRPTSNIRDKTIPTRSNLNQLPYHTSSNNINDNNNSSSYVNYNDLAIIPSARNPVRAPMIAKRTSSQLSSTTSGSDVTTSSARSDGSDLNENMSIHSLHPFSYGSSPSHSYHSNHNSGSNQYQRQTSFSSHLSGNTSSGTSSSTVSPSFHPLTSPHYHQPQTSPSSPSSSVGGLHPLHSYHPTRMKRTSVVRSAHLMENPSRPVQANGRFGNPWDTWAPLRFTNILKWGLAKDKSNIPSKEVSHSFLPLSLFTHSFFEVRNNKLVSSFFNRARNFFEGKVLVTMNKNM